MGIKKPNKRTITEMPLAALALKALKEAVAEAIARHKKNGNTIAVWRNGKVALIAPEEIIVPSVE